MTHSRESLASTKERKQQAQKGAKKKAHKSEAKVPKGRTRWAMTEIKLKTERSKRTKAKEKLSVFTVEIGHHH